MADLDEISLAVETAKKNGCSDLALLHCVSAYPTPVEECNVNVISDLAKKFDVVVGLSDHSLDNTVPVAAVAVGASIIEKHFTLDRNGGGPDDTFSMEPEDLTKLVKSTQIAWRCLGKVTYEHQVSEQKNLKFRRSLYFVKSLKAGDVIKSDDIRSIRPGHGLNPKHYDKVVGCKLNSDVSFGEAVSWDVLEQIVDRVN